MGWERQLQWAGEEVSAGAVESGAGGVVESEPLWLSVALAPDSEPELLFTGEMTLSASDSVVPEPLPLAGGTVSPVSEVLSVVLSVVVEPVSLSSPLASLLTPAPLSLPLEPLGEPFSPPVPPLDPVPVEPAGGKEARAT